MPNVFRITACSWRSMPSATIAMPSSRATCTSISTSARVRKSLSISSMNILSILMRLASIDFITASPLWPVPASSSATSNPALRSASVVAWPACIEVRGWRSVTSTTMHERARPVSSISRVNQSANPVRSNWAGAMLTASLRPPCALSVDPSSARARRIRWATSASAQSFSSTSGMNCAGGMNVPSPRRQRARISKPIGRPSANETIGW